MVDLYYLYTITNNIDKSKYIGITNDTKRRFREHKSNTSNKYLSIAQALFGHHAFNYKVECIGSREYISWLEQEYIFKLRDYGEILYNVAKGGLIGSGMPGEEHWNARLTQDDVLHIRNMYASNLLTQRKIAELFKVDYKHISQIVRGDKWKSAPGPITVIKQQISKVANRRKLTDTQVVELRNEALIEFNNTGKLDIPDIANMYDMARGSIRLILLGVSYSHLPGPLLKRDYYEGFGK